MCTSQAVELGSAQEVERGVVQGIRAGGIPGMCVRADMVEGSEADLQRQLRPCYTREGSPGSM